MPHPHEARVVTVHALAQLQVDCLAVVNHLLGGIELGQQLLLLRLRPTFPRPKPLSITSARTPPGGIEREGTERLQMAIYLTAWGFRIRWGYAIRQRPAHGSGRGRCGAPCPPAPSSE